MDNEQKLIAEDYMKKLQTGMKRAGKKFYPEDWSIVEDRDGKVYVRKESPDRINAVLNPVPTKGN